MADFNHGRNFSLSISPAAYSTLKSWRELASTQGFLNELLETYKQLSDKLIQSPITWGDPLWEYPHIAAKERCGNIPQWLIAWYGVEEVARVVILRSLRPAPGSRLQ